jgi:hypothetical protein
VLQHGITHDPEKLIMLGFVVEKSMLKLLLRAEGVTVGIIDDVDAIVVEATGTDLRPNVLWRRKPSGEYSLS